MIDLDTAKAHLRVTDGSEDTAIGIYLKSAIASVQKMTGKLLAPAQVKQVVAGFPGWTGYRGGYAGSGYWNGDCARIGGVDPIRLWYGPIDAATAALMIEYDDPNGAATPLTDFRIIEGSNAKLLPAYGSYWPIAQSADGSVRIAYTAGYADGQVPPELDQAVLYLVGHYFENRNAVEAGLRAAAVEIPLAVADLIAPYRPVGIF